MPTRGCNLDCAYCGFQASADGSHMDPRLVRTAIDWYLELVAAGSGAAQVHFFGGEPFCAPEVVEFAVLYAGLKAAQVGCSVSFEVATNGTMDEELCHWVASSLDSVLVSLDGPADIQDRQRARHGGQGSFEAVARSARILSEGSAELSFRACVTAGNEERMPEIAAWFCREFRPAAVCFEPLTPTQPSEAAGLQPPDPWVFAREFMKASAVLASWRGRLAADVRFLCEETGCRSIQVEPAFNTVRGLYRPPSPEEGDEFVAAFLEAHDAARRAGRRLTYSGARPWLLTGSFCSAPYSSLIVNAAGELVTCYEVTSEDHPLAPACTIGRLEGSRPIVQEDRRQAMLRRMEARREGCRDCFCYWHCAGDCHVKAFYPGTEAAPGASTRCRVNRAITLELLLARLAETEDGVWRGGNGGRGDGR